MCLEQAEASALWGLETSLRLAESFPDRLDLTLAAVRSLAILAGGQSQRGGTDPAIVTQGEAIGSCEQASARFADSVQVRDGLATSLANRGALWSTRQDHRKTLQDIRPR